MLKFYRARETTSLADRLLEVLRANPPVDLLSAESFIVQNHGMARWLTTRIASEVGIAANLRFQFPAEQIWDLYRSMDPGIPQDLPSDLDPMTWALYWELESLPNNPPYGSINRYVRGGEGVPGTIKIWKLARQIADLYDRYLVYRPEMLLSWENKTLEGLGSGEEWQAALWRRLVSRWKHGNNNTGRLHRAAIHRDFMEALERREIDEKRLPERISIFGVSTVPPAFIEAYMGVAAYTETDIYWYWNDPWAGGNDHPLQKSWGQTGKNFITLLEDESKRFKLDSGFEVLEADTSSSAPGLDVTVQVHSCHSRNREVEVLHDRLLDLFDCDNSLAPEDILVQVNDVEQYAPFIDSVFGVSEGELPGIPYHIVGNRSGARKEVFTAFSQLLGLVESRFKVTEVLDLLSNRVVMDRFGMSEDDLDRCTRWIRRAKIRWGLNADNKREFDLPGSGRFSWEFGLNRMMLGFASHMEENVFRELFPLEGIESSDDAVLLGKLSAFLERLAGAYSERREDRSPAEWAQTIRKWAGWFITDDPDYHDGLSELLEHVDTIDRSTRLGSTGSCMEYLPVAHFLSEKLESGAGRGGYIGNGVTFCGLDAMRNIPFEVIAMLGVDNENFPRSRITPDFDLIERHPRSGDPIRKEDDRYLFLEMFNSAGGEVYLSYRGQSNRDDSSRPPSVLISELVDYRAEKQGNKTADLIREHPLHPFSTKYFSGDEEFLYTYSSAMQEIRHQIDSGKIQSRPFLEQLPEPGEGFNEIALEEWIGFFQHPAKYLLQNRLGIYLWDEDIITESREPFKPDNLDKYILGSEMVNRSLEDKPLESYKMVARGKGLLPDGWIGSQAFNARKQQVDSYMDLVRPFREKKKLDPVQVDMELGDLHVVGMLDALYEEYQLLYRFGRMRAKDFIEGWIKHLALQAAGTGNQPEKTYYIARKGNKDPVIWKYRKVEKDLEYLLAELGKLYRRGLTRKLPLFPETSKKYTAEIVDKKNDEASALKRAGKKWESGKYNRGEDDDPYIKLLYENDPPFGTKEFKNISLKFWSTLLDHVEKVEGLDG